MLEAGVEFKALTLGPRAVLHIKHITGQGADILSRQVQYDHMQGWSLVRVRPHAVQTVGVPERAPVGQGDGR
jgi:hypothetical protein